MSEITKLVKMGIETPQTRYYLAQQNKKEPTEAYIVEQEPRKPLEFIGTLRVNEFGDVVHPPVKPEPPEEPDTSNWVRMTAKRQGILAQYRKDCADYEVAMVEYHIAMEKWLELTPINDAEPHPPIITKSDDNPVLVYWARGFGEVCVTSKPVTHTELEILEVREEIQTLFTGNSSQERRRYKRNRDLNMNTEYDTDLDTGEKRQLTLFNCPTSAPVLRNVNEGIIESFVAKPNSYLSNAFYEYAMGRGELSDWQRFQLRRRIHRVGML